MPRVYAPDEEIPFHFTATEINAVIAAVETTLGLPLRVTAPLREKILNQLNLSPQPDGDGLDAGQRAEAGIGPLPVPSNRASRARN